MSVMTWAHRLPGERLVERITTEARDVRFAVVALTVVAGLFWLAGWSAAKVLGAVWLCLAWSAVAVRVGWQEARRPPGDPAG